MKLNAISYLFVKEVVGEVVEDHGVRRVDGVGFRQKLHSALNRVLRLLVELEDGESDQRTHALRVELKGTLKCHPEGTSEAQS